jgi:hypothetical protein
MKPTTVMTTLDAGCASRFFNDPPSSEVACPGITVPRCAMRCEIVFGPATSVKRPTATSNTEGIAKKLLYASADASIGPLSRRNDLPARTIIAIQSVSCTALERGRTPIGCGRMV